VPELPEVEVVRRGLAPAVTGARIAAVEVRDPRALKRHLPQSGDDGIGGHGVTMTAAAGQARAADFERRLTGAVLAAPARRGKFMWIPILRQPSFSPGSTEDLSANEISDRAASSTALLAHLGMSGQMLLRSHDAPDDRHVRIRMWLEHQSAGELRIDFVDQRLFGSLAIDQLVPTPDGPSAAHGTELALMPGQAVHIARDPLDPAFDDVGFVRGLRRRGNGVKVALLDQGLISGVGNIYADEALWRARVHPETPGRSIGARKAAELLTRIREVFEQALAEGGTSFDEQYVNVNGQAGYFARSLRAYGRTGEPCERCGTPIKRIVVGGRSTHFCPRCQRRRHKL